MKTLLAIDPGQSGGIAVSHDDAHTRCEPMPPTQGDVLDALRSIVAVNGAANTTAYLEQVGGFVGGGGQPGSAMFKFGESFGFIKGVLMAMGVRLVLVRPQEWQKHFSLGTARSCASKSEWKNKLKAEAQRRFPQCTVTLKTADALLILDYAITGESGELSPVVGS